MVHWWLWLIIILAAFLVLLFLSYFNKIVVLSNRIDNAFSQIDVQLKKRADLVPNLIEAVKGYMKHERGIMTEVTNARKALLAAGDMSQKLKAGDSLQNALKSIFAIAENYPNLKANENFLNLQEQLGDIENKIAYSRQFYNDSILSYNNTVKTIPGMWFASLFKKTEKPYLEAKAEERKNVKVEF
ncbi:hypothetical protein CO154_02600 [Candidatus Pacearchaeota archaeon CG_4_9_14_3_um_filter_31_7]|nr:MAG: hypothetical protein AUJ10_04070 [Candidatus Pacearchaeota archaeon CG1_02_31_27]PIN91921.1 MAG: hypothetical protein COU55_03435 [Candidatus Pacearchaeota archaeon CG10_big_fil_rev_8_21_14_0_10_31_59]PIZ80480.1 MAG: hypothetical protein COX99_02290 [Candidatus Pacearchaeota archaeon CG_4_10_14_0_2_um_filter_31_10]PJA70498.1 MAG: hypothetical protein CO154_02600 [Candidatus Pacearchaeota archaeon CG_4_9_14_3_um_filter_31_7]